MKGFRCWMTAMRPNHRSSLVCFWSLLLRAALMTLRTLSTATEKKMSCIPFFFAEKHHSRLSLHKQSQEPRSSDVPPEGAADERPALDPPTSAASTMSPQARHSKTSHKQTLKFWICANTSQSPQHLLQVDKANTDVMQSFSSAPVPASAPPASSGDGQESGLLVWEHLSSHQ